MKPISFRTAIVLVLTATAFSQAAQQTPAFEIADIRPHAANRLAVEGPMVIGGRYLLQAATFVDLIVLSYGVKPERVVGGPAWLDTNRYDIMAKVPPNSPVSSRKEMLKALLAARFKLSVHNEDRLMPAYALRAGKKPLLKPGDSSGAAGCGFRPVQGSNGLLDESCHNATMEMLVTSLMNIGGFSGQQLLDETSLKGTWTFDFKIRRPNAGVPAGEERFSVFDAVESIGLTIVQMKTTESVLVVDRVDENPTPNAANIAELLPPFPEEFEVAAIKPSDPTSTNLRFLMQPGGRLVIQGQTLKNIIQRAWNIDSRNADETLIAPKFLDQKFDITAQTPSLGEEEAYNGPAPYRLDLENIMTMLRNLLIKRFKMVIHYEDRPINAFTLSAIKPKLQKADPSNRSGCSRDIGLAQNDARNANTLLVPQTCKNMSMAQFALELPQIASAYIRGANILDATGLDGAWDFNFGFNGIGLGGPQPADIPSPGALAAASVPASGVTLFEALEKQLGLKLEKTKRASRVMVIDQMEQKPVDN